MLNFVEVFEELPVMYPQFNFSDALIDKIIDLEETFYWVCLSQKSV